MPQPHCALQTSLRPYPKRPQQESNTWSVHRSQHKAEFLGSPTGHREIQHPPGVPVPNQNAPAQSRSLPSCGHAGGCPPCGPSQAPPGVHSDVGGHPGSFVLGWAPAPLPAAEGLAGGQAGRHWGAFHSAPRRPVLTRWLRSYSAIFSISSFIFSMFCLRRSSHSWGQDGTGLSERTTQPAMPKRQGAQILQRPEGHEGQLAWNSL